MCKIDAARWQGIRYSWTTAPTCEGSSVSDWLVQIAIFLTAAVVAVPIAQRLKLGAILGYLFAGAAIGPWGFGLIAGVENVLHIAEFGVVLLLFLIGLGMRPRRLWTLRRTILGLGAAQVGVSALLLTLGAFMFGLPVASAVVVGLALALSSTAFALQIMSERREMGSRHGRAGFGVLLFQDLAVIPILAVLPLLAAGTAAIGLDDALLKTGKIAVVLTVMLVGGHYLLRPMFRLVAATRMPEVFMAWALLVVVGTAVIMETFGISVALGAFAAGVLLADSEYRAAMEANINPFKDLLLGLFFIGVGMSLNLGLLLAKPVEILLLTAALLAIKAVVLYLLGRRHGLAPESSRSFAAILPQGGEFAFVILAAATTAGVLVQDVRDEVVAIVTLSMGLTPAVVGAGAWLNRRLARYAATLPAEAPAEPEHPVVIAGFGRIGQIVARLLTAKNIPFTALEIDPNIVDFVRRFGDKVYYGDASKLSLLRHAGAGDARVFVLAIGDPDASVRTAELVRRHYPHLKIVASARNRRHAFALTRVGVPVILREKFLTAVEMGDETLQALGLSRAEAQRSASLFRQYDQQLISDQAKLAADHDVAKLVQLRKEAMAELEELFERDVQRAEESGPD